MDFTVTSDRLNISGNVENFDKISLNIDSKRLYLYKIIPLPLELEHKYLISDLNFNAQLSKKYLELRGYIYSNKRFRAYLNLLNSKEKGFSAKVNTEHLPSRSRWRY